MARPSRPDMDLSGTMLEPPPGLDPDCLLFLGDPNMKTYSLFERWVGTAGLSFGFLAVSLAMNAMNRAPLRAGIQRHLYCTLVGGGSGEAIWRVSHKWAAEKDMQYYHYMITHPEDFQAPERRKWADVLQPWLPFR